MHNMINETGCTGTGTGHALHDWYCNVDRAAVITNLPCPTVLSGLCILNCKVSSLSSRFSYASTVLSGLCILNCKVSSLSSRFSYASTVLSGLCICNCRLAEATTSKLPCTTDTTTIFQRGEIQ